MGCTPSAQQSQPGIAQFNDNDEEPTYDQNKNSNNCRITENHSKGKAGRSWRKKAEKIHLEEDRKKETSLKGEERKNKLENSNWIDSERGPFNLTTKTNLRILLAFPKEDNMLDHIVQVVEKLGYEYTSCHSTETIMNSYVQTGHDIVVLDHRNIKHLDAIALCRKMRHTKWGAKSVVVAVIKKSYLEDSYCLPLLNAGFNRCIVETSNMGALVNEFVDIEQGEVKPRLSIANSHAMFVALSKCRDLVQITDESFLIQFINSATELALGFKSEEIKGKSIWEIHQGTEFETTISRKVMRGKEWEGIFLTRRKTGEPISLPCKVLGSPTQGRNINNFIFIQEALIDGSGNIPKDQHPRGSLHSIRKGSYDVKSLASESGQSLRRQSLAKLNSLPIEAPITKIITLLYSVHEQSTLPVQQQIEKVVDIVKSTELYSPQLKENRIRPDDPITTDLISALLAQSNVPVSTTRRSSNDSANVKGGTTASRPSILSINAPGQLSSVLEQSLDWEFDIFRLEEVSGQRPLVWLGMNLLCHFSVPATLGCDEKTLMNWLTVVEMHYQPTNSYHNSTHAADVMQASSCYMKRQRLQELLDPLDVACTLIAACCHDIDHPGKSSIFLCNSDHDLAILYNDLSVLESHHAAMTFKLTMADDRVNIFKGLERDTYKVARQSIIDMILATEMTRHFEHLTKFVNVFTKPEPREEDFNNEGELSEIAVMNTRENIALAKRMLIKCADVSNPTRPLKQCVEWARRIAEEYFNQTDEEKANGLPVVMPMFDRSTCSIPKSQMGFVDFIINDMMEAWDSFIELPEMLYYLRSNYQYWKEKEDEGVTSIHDLYPLNSKIDFLSEVDESKAD